MSYHTSEAGLVYSWWQGPDAQWLDRYEPGGRQWGLEGLFTHGKAPATLSTRKSFQILGKRAGKARRPLRPYHAGF